MFYQQAWRTTGLLLIGLLLIGQYAGEPVQAQFGSLFGGSPTVETITVTELRSLLDKQQQAEKQARQDGRDKPAADFVLVDVRTDEEVNVSVIPGAIPKAQYEANRDRYKNQTVIAYCTVGGRSNRYAQQLKTEGVKVKNFKGSILEWTANELPLVTLDGKPTNRVHLYSGRYKVPAKYEAVTE